MHGCIKKKGNSCMNIKNNLSSYNSNRQLGIVVDRQAKSSEKSSSVYKIIRAADDAALLFSQQPALRCLHSHLMSLWRILVRDMR